MHEITLDGADTDVFKRSCNLLRDFSTASLHVQDFAVAIAILIHRRAPAAPSSGPARLIERARSGTSLKTGELEKLVCDPTWEKDQAFLPPGVEGPIYKPFIDSFKPRSSSKNNNWRNSFDLQGGLRCDAPSDLLSDPAFVSQSRRDCKFRDQVSGSCGAPDGDGAVCFNPAKRGPASASSTAKPRPKFIALGDKSQRWFIGPTVESLAGLLAQPGLRVPVYPFAGALYGGSSYFKQWGTEISSERLQRDLVLGQTEFETLFDIDPASSFNANLLEDFAPQQDGTPTTHTYKSAGEDDDLHYESGHDDDDCASKPLSNPVPYKQRSSTELQERAGKTSDPTHRRRLLERANEGHRRTLHFVVKYIERAGYTVDEQLDGYDLRAARGDLTCLFEVKTWTSKNLARQVRAGWAQLHEYRYLNRGRLPDAVGLYLVLDREPPLTYWSWQFLAEQEAVVTCWSAGDALVTLPAYEAQLPII